MSQTGTGVYQLKNGYWEYRFVVKVEGNTLDRKSRKDEAGNPLKTRKAAEKARALAIKKAAIFPSSTKKQVRKTYAEVYADYCENGRFEKAFTTIKKQDSLWKNHISKKFGSRFIDDVSVAEINDYLSLLYYEENRSYKYVESFLKMFYLILGQAYSRNYLDAEIYSKLCLNKGTKIKMPKRRTTEDDEVVAFSEEEAKQLGTYFKGTNAETAYLLGRYCGLRINECYGLKWENIDVAAGLIYIDRQMQYQDGLIKLVQLKTHNAKRTIYMNNKLKVYFQDLTLRREEWENSLAAVRNQNQTFIEDLDGSKISSLELVNSLPNGKIQTVNSMKYHSQKIKKDLGIEFKFHYLRHTYGTRMADMNTPTHLLCNQMGHASVRVTQKYYIALSRTGINILVENLNKL